MLDIEKILSDFGVDRSFAKQFTNPQELYDWLVGPHYRNLSRLLSDAQKLEVGEAALSMARVNSGLSTLKSVSPDEFAEAITSLRNRPTPNFLQLVGLQEDNERLIGELETERKLAVARKSRLQNARKFQLRLVEHLALSAARAPIDPVVDKVHFTQIRNCVIVTKREVLYVTHSGFVNSIPWAVGDLSKLPLLLGYESRLYRRRSLADLESIERGEEPKRRMSNSSLFDSSVIPGQSYQVLGCFNNASNFSWEKPDEINDCTDQITKIIEYIDPVVEVGSRLALITKTGVNITGTKVVRGKTVPVRAAGLLMRVTEEIIGIVGPFQLDQTTVFPPAGFEFEIPERIVVKENEINEKKRKEKEEKEKKKAEKRRRKPNIN